jgi:hypothetical protein
MPKHVGSLGHDPVKVPLAVIDHNGQVIPLWKNFIAHAHKKVGDRAAHELIKDEMKQELCETYGAHTNWKDGDDPIWFPDQESLVQFVLTWSKD